MRINMQSYVQAMLFNAPADMDCEAVTPTAGHLFHMNKENPVPLGTEKKETFMHLLMQTLYLRQWD